MGAAQLIELEERFWKGGADFYREKLAPDSLMVFGDPVGTLEKEAAIASISDAPRWRDVRFTDVQHVSLSPDVMLLTYRVAAGRDGMDRDYAARASSVYVRRDGEWRLAFHQQTPAQQ